MPNILSIPTLNPINFIDANQVNLPQYLSRPYTDYAFIDTILPDEERVVYAQKWQTNNILNLQFESNFDPISISVIDRYGIVVLNLNATQKRVNKYEPGLYVYEASISWSTFLPGIYYIQISHVNQVLVISEPQCIAVSHPGTIYHQYFNSRFHENLVFETGIVFNFLIEGEFHHGTFGSADEVFTDQKYNSTLLSSKPYSGIILRYGGNYGIPDWAIEKINYIWSCNNVSIDGREYAKSSDTKISLTEEEHYPLRGIEMEVRNGRNRGSKVISPDLNTNQELLVVYNISSRVFGDVSENASSNVIRILSNE